MLLNSKSSCYYLEMYIIRKILDSFLCFIAKDFIMFLKDTVLLRSQDSEKLWFPVICIDCN